MRELLLAEPPTHLGRARTLAEWVHHRLGDAIRCAAYASRRGVGFDPETWLCYALGHARVKARRGASASGGFWWALTRANGLADLEADVSPNLDEQLENAERVVASSVIPEPRPFDHDPAKRAEDVPTIAKVMLEDPVLRARRDEARARAELRDLESGR